MRSAGSVIGAVLVAGVLLAGCGDGALRPATQTGRADVDMAGDGGTIHTDAWDYELPISGVAWVDGAGTLHDGGRPECLVPGASTQIRFASVEVQLDGTTWRPVVWISCQA